MNLTRTFTELLCVPPHSTCHEKPNFKTIQIESEGGGPSSLTCNYTHLLCAYLFLSLPLGEEGGDHRLDDDTRKMRRGIIKFLLLFTERERERGGFVVVLFAFA